MSGFGNDRELSYSVNLDLQGAEQELRNFQQRIQMNQQLAGVPSMPGAPAGGVINDPVYSQIAQVFELQSSKSATERAVTEYLQQAGGATPYGFTKSERLMASAVPAAMGAVAAGFGALALGPVAPILGLGAAVGGAVGYSAGSALGAGIPEAITTHLATRHLLREDELAGRIKPMTASERSDVATGIRRAADFYDVDIEAALRMYNQASDSSSVFKDKSPEEFKENAVKLIRQWKTVSLIMYDSLEEAGRAVEEMERRKLLTRDPTQMAQLVSMARMASTLTGTPMNQVLDTTQAITQQFSYGTTQAPGDVARGLLPYYTQWQETYQNLDPKQKELVKNLGGPDLLFGTYNAAARNYLANTRDGAAILYAQALANKTGQDLQGGLQSMGAAMQTMTPYELMSFQGEAAERFAEMTPGAQARTIVDASKTFIDPSVAPKTQDAVTLFLTHKLGLPYQQAKAMAQMLTPMATEEGKYQDFWMNVKASGMAKHAAEAVDNNAESIVNWTRRTFGTTGPLGTLTAWTTDLLMPDETSFTWKTQHGTDKAQAFDDLSRDIFGAGSGASGGPLANVRGTQHALSALEQFSDLVIKGEVGTEEVVETVTRELDEQDVPPALVTQAADEIREIAKLDSPQKRQFAMSQLITKYREMAKNAKRDAYAADDMRTAKGNADASKVMAGYRRTKNPSAAATLAFQHRLATDVAAPANVREAAEEMEQKLKTGTALEKEAVKNYSRGLTQRSAADDPSDYLRDVMQSGVAVSVADVPTGTPGFGGITKDSLEHLVDTMANDPQLEGQRKILQGALQRIDSSGKVQLTNEERGALALGHKGTMASNVYELSGRDKAKAAQFAGAVESNRSLFEKDTVAAVDKVMEDLKASGMYTAAELQQRRGLLADLHTTALHSDDYAKSMKAGLDALTQGAQNQAGSRGVSDTVLKDIIDDAYSRNAVAGGRDGNRMIRQSAVNEMGRAMDLFRKIGSSENLPQMLKEIDRKLADPKLPESDKTRLLNAKTVMENLPGMTPEDREKALQQVTSDLVMDVSTKTRDDILKAKFGSAYDKNREGMDMLRNVGSAARKMGSDLPDVLTSYDRQAKEGSAGSKLLAARGVEELEVEYGGTKYKVDLEDVNFGDRESVLEYVKSKGFKGIFQRDKVLTAEDERKFTDKLVAAQKNRVRAEMSSPDMQEAMKRSGLTMEDYVRDPEGFMQSIGRVERDKNPVRDYGNAAAGLSAQLDEHAKLMGKLTDTIAAENTMMRQATSGRTAR